MALTLPTGLTESQLRQMMPSFYADPLGYVIFAFPWGEGDLAGHDGPDEWQREVLEDVGRAVTEGAQNIRHAIASGHGIGKGALTAWIVLWAMSTRPHLNGVVTANTKAQLDGKTWRELSVWHKRAVNRHWFEMISTKFFQVDHPSTWLVSAIPWSEEKPEGFQGLHGDHVLTAFDEASAISDKIFEATEGSMTTPGAMWFVFGNPTRPQGAFRDCFGRLRHRWATRQIDGRACRLTDKNQIAEWVQDYGEDSDFVRVRVKGEFPRAGTTQFIGLDVVEMAQGREPVRDGPKVLGVDIARFGDDETVVIEREGDACEIVARWRGVDTMQTAARIAEIWNERDPDQVFIDGVGVGGGVVDRLRHLHFAPFDVNGGGRPSDEAKYHNLRAESWALMRDWIRKRGCLPEDHQLVDDLTAPEYGFDAHNRIQLEKKERMKARGMASPDSADALALTFAAPVSKRAKRSRAEDDRRRRRVELSHMAA